MRYVNHIGEVGVFGRRQLCATSEVICIVARWHTVCWRDHRQHADNGRAVDVQAELFQVSFLDLSVDVVEQRAREASDRVKSAVGFASEISTFPPTSDPSPDIESLRLNEEFQSVQLQPDQQ